MRVIDPRVKPEDDRSGKFEDDKEHKPENEKDFLTFFMILKQSPGQARGLKVHHDDSL